MSISGGNAVTLPKYDDSALKASVEELKAKDTELANKDQELTNEVNALKVKTDNFVSGVSVNKEGNKVKLTYSYVDGSNKEVEFEDSDTVTLAYDDTAVKERLTALETKEDKDTIYNDVEVKAQIQTVDTKVDNNKQAQNTKNTELENRIGALESKEDKDTIYDDSALKAKVSELTEKDTSLDARISALEIKPDKGTVYDDTALAGRVSALEAKEDKDTVYNDAELRGKVESLETKDTELAKSIADNKTDADNRLKVLEAKEDSDKQTLSLTDHTLSISNGNSVELPKYDDTEVKAKNTEQDEEIKALKEKTKSFLTGAGVTRQGNVVTLTYTNIDGSSTNLEFNDNDTKAIAYDDTALKDRVQELENRESNGTIYNDTPIKERLNALENKVDKDTVYDDTPLKERITALETKGDNDTHYNVKSTTDGLTVVKSQENGEEVFTINADLAFNKYYTKGEIDKAIADNNKRTQKLVKYNATWKSPDSFRYTNDGRVPVLSHNNVTSFGSMKLDGVILKPMSANTIICEFPPNTPKPIEFIEVQAYIGNEPISMWYTDRTVRVTDVPQSLVGKRVIFNFVGLFA